MADDTGREGLESVIQMLQGILASGRHVDRVCWEQENNLMGYYDPTRINGAFSVGETLTIIVEISPQHKPPTPTVDTQDNDDEPGYSEDGRYDEWD